MKNETRPSEFKSNTSDASASTCDVASRGKDESCHTACSTKVNISREERAISSCVGGALLLFGLGRIRMDALLIMLGGGALLYRGMTGHCHGYDMLGINTAEPNEAESPTAWSVEQSETAGV